VTPTSSAEPGRGYYSFASAGSGGTVEVIVLDYSRPSLDSGQRCWLAGQLANAGSAGVPAVVVGQRDLGGQAPDAAADAAAVLPILLTGQPPGGCAEATGNTKGASAYFFDYPEQNREYSLSAGGRSIPAFGSGTLGYVTPPQVRETDFVGAGGFLVASVDVSRRDPTTNVAPVSVRLIPNVGALALDATDGTLLRRGHPALFDALARRPAGGDECIGAAAPRECEVLSPDPYAPIPSTCQGRKCATGVFPEYTFSSSRPDIADFVSQDPASLNPRNVLLVGEKPVRDPHSGLLCAFNAGTTTVTVSTGGLAYSEKVTVLAGTVQRPCGTTPLLSRATSGPAAAVPPPAPSPTPGFSPGPAPPLPPPPPPTAGPVPLAIHPTLTPLPPPAAVAPFFTPPPAPVPLVPIVPPPPAPAFQPTPPSGTSPVTSPVEEREEEQAFDLVHHMTALRSAGRAASGGAGPPFLVPALVLIAALAAAGLGSTRPRTDVQRRLAYEATTNPRRNR